VGYPIMVFFCTVICIVFRYFLIQNIENLTDRFGGSSVCSSVVDVDARNACYGNQFVYRLGFAHVLFFAAMTVLVPCFRRGIHDGAWCLKIVVVLGTLVGSFWIGDDTMATFANVCLWGSSVFIIVQVLCLLEWVYALSESWRDKAEQDDIYFKYLMGSTVFCYLGALTFIIVTIVQFAAGGCGFAAAEISITVIACVLFSILSISGLSPDGSLLCSAMVTLYASFYCWSALSGMDSSVTDSDGSMCNTLLSSDGSGATATNVIIGLVLTCCSLAWSAYCAGDAGSIGVDPTNRSQTVNNDIYANTASNDPEGGGANYQAMEHEDWGGAETIKPLVIYHVIMIVCTMYMMMTIVNWDVDPTAPKATVKDFGTGSTVVWSKTLSQWLAIVLYTWTLCARKCLNACGIERDFDYSYSQA